MTETTTETVAAVRADVEADEASRRRRRSHGGARIPTRAQRDASRELHILNTATVIDRARLEDVDRTVEDVCVICGGHRNLPVAPRAHADMPKVPAMLTFVDLDRIRGPICNRCERVWLQNDLAETVTRRLWEERPHDMSAAGFRKDPGQTAVDAGVDGTYDVVADPRQYVWGLYVLDRRKDGRPDPKRPKSPFGWITLEKI